MNELAEVKEIVRQKNHLYTSLYKKYLASKAALVPLEYEFLINLGQVALKDGRLRRAIEFTREALARTENDDERVFVYLSLSRMYRMMIYMQNAKSELKRAFAIYKVDFPHSGTIPFLASLTSLLYSIPTTSSKDTTHTKRQKLLVALYEEAGLSAYYMREPLFLLIQISLQARKVVSKLNISLETMNYLAATATAFSISTKGSLGNSYMNKARTIAKGLKDKKTEAKLKIWEILQLSYQNKGVESAALTEDLIAHEKKHLTPYDLRLISTTLALNYIVRGKARESLAAVDITLTDYDHSSDNVFSSSKPFIEWYKIPALGFMGKNKEAERIMVNSKAIFTSVDEERWQLAIYLGGLITYQYFSNRRDMSEIQNIQNRFDSISLSPQKTFMEAQLFWIGKAYLMLDLYYQGQASKKQLVEAVTNVGKITYFNATFSHHLVLRAHLYFIDKNYRQAESSLEKALTASNKFKNDWSKYEAEKLMLVLLRLNKKTESANILHTELKKNMRSHGWNNCLLQLEKFLNYSL